MKLIKPFCGLRPTQEVASQVASHPYDVINREEAIEIAKDNPYSFLHINKPEIDVDINIDAFDDRVYAKGNENLNRFISEGILQQDNEDKFYVYRQIMGAHSQIGMVAVASLDAYEKGLIKKHEFTRPDKEDDRVNHMDALGAQVGPVFLTYKSEAKINKLIEQVTATKPEYDFEADDETRHTFWVVEDTSIAGDIESAFDNVECLYVADGHHRSAAACRVKHIYQKRNDTHDGTESYNHFLVVLFPHDQMQILDYNRILKDLNGLSAQEFISALQESFDVIKVDSHQNAKPIRERQFAIYCANTWYRLTANSDLVNSIDTNDPVKSLDVTIMQDNILSPLLNINDQRTDKRIDFVGGIRGLPELEKRVDSGEWEGGIALYATSIESLMAIADANEVMPPKTTWFEPKLRSGLVVHMLD